MLVDSHCHLNFPELAEQLPEVLAAMQANQVTHALVVAVKLADFGPLLALVEPYAHLFATVGVHPDERDAEEVEEADLLDWARKPKVVGIGETGLDYHGCKGEVLWQQQRFRTHIRVARQAGLPLIIHTREAANDTLRILTEEGAWHCGGVMHCFTENWDTARAALDLGFYISFSGIVTFKNAQQVKEVAQKVPLERLLIETDSPYLAPVPYRGKLNQPAYVKYVAQSIAQLRGLSYDKLAQATSDNFFSLFKRAC